MQQRVMWQPRRAAGCNDAAIFTGFSTAFSSSRLFLPPQDCSPLLTADL